LEKAAVTGTSYQLMRQTGEWTKSATAATQMLRYQWSSNDDYLGHFKKL